MYWETRSDTLSPRAQTRPAAATWPASAWLRRLAAVEVAVAAQSMGAIESGAAGLPAMSVTPVMSMVWRAAIGADRVSRK